MILKMSAGKLIHNLLFRPLKMGRSLDSNNIKQLKTLSYCREKCFFYKKKKINFGDFKILNTILRIKYFKKSKKNIREFDKFFFL